MSFFRDKETLLRLRKERDEKMLLELQRKKEKKQQEKEEKKKPDVSSEQEPGAAYTTEYCPQAVSDMKLIKKNPENYLEVNIIRKSRVVDTFAVSIDTKKLLYKKHPYDIIEESIYLLPTKAGYLMPTSFYK